MLFKGPKQTRGTNNCTTMGPQTSKIKAGGGYAIGFRDPKSTKFRSWVVWWLLGGLGGVLGPSRKRFGEILGASWGCLGSFWGRIGAPWGSLRGVLGRLGVVLGRLGAVLGCTRGVSGRPGLVLEASWVPWELPWALHGEPGAKSAVVIRS